MDISYDTAPSLVGIVHRCWCSSWVCFWYYPTTERQMRRLAAIKSDCSRIRWFSIEQWCAVWSSVVECSAVWISVVQCGAVWISVVQCGAVWWCVVQWGAVWNSMVKYSAVWISVYQGGAVWSSVEQFEASILISVPNSPAVGFHHKVDIICFATLSLFITRARAKLTLNFKLFWDSNLNVNSPIKTSASRAKPTWLRIIESQYLNPPP